MYIFKAHTEDGTRVTVNLHASQYNNMTGNPYVDMQQGYRVAVICNNIKKVVPITYTNKTDALNSVKKLIIRDGIESVLRG